MQLEEVSLYLDKLRKPLRDALLLVGVKGLGYGDAAPIANCPVGTIKSRVARARANLRAMLSSGHLRRRSALQVVSDRVIRLLHLGEANAVGAPDAHCAPAIRTCLSQVGEMRSDPSAVGQTFGHQTR